MSVEGLERIVQAVGGRQRVGHGLLFSTGSAVAPPALTGQRGDL
ncbi:hypothetical protein [Microbacterium sp. NPDC087868]